jgi:hypothetical protein
VKSKLKAKELVCAQVVEYLPSKHKAEFNPQKVGIMRKTQRTLKIYENPTQNT